MYSVLIPVVPDVLHVVVLGRFMRKESSKIPLKINSFRCLRRFKVAFFLIWYVTILLDRFSITDAKAQVNSYIAINTRGGEFSFYNRKAKNPPAHRFVYNNPHRV